MNTFHKFYKLSFPEMFDLKRIYLNPLRDTNHEKSDFRIEERIKRFNDEGSYFRFKGLNLEIKVPQNVVIKYHTIDSITEENNSLSKMSISFDSSLGYMFTLNIPSYRLIDSLFKDKSASWKEAKTLAKISYVDSFACIKISLRKFYEFLSDYYEISSDALDFAEKFDLKNEFLFKNKSGSLYVLPLEYEIFLSYSGTKVALLRRNFESSLVNKILESL